MGPAVCLHFMIHLIFAHCHERYGNHVFAGICVYVVFVTKTSMNHWMTVVKHSESPH